MVLEFGVFLSSGGTAFVLCTTCGLVRLRRSRLSSRTVHESLELVFEPLSGFTLQGTTKHKACWIFLATAARPRACSGRRPPSPSFPPPPLLFLCLLPRQRMEKRQVEEEHTQREYKALEVL